MAAAAGIKKQVKIKREVTYGTPPAAGSSQLLRRVESTFSLEKDTYQSNEIRTDYQMADFRHGVRRAPGTLSGELSPGTYAEIFAQVLKREWATVTAVTGASITIAGAGPTYTVTRGAGDFLTGGFKIGQVIRLTVGSFNAANLNKNLLIIALTATIATVMPLNGVALVAEGPIASSTVTVQGKTNYVPVTGHTDLSFSLEHWFSDVPASEVFAGIKFGQVQMRLPPTGMATVEFSGTGQNVVTSASEYFTAPTAITTSGVVAAVNGLAIANGAAVANLTGLEFTMALNFSGDPVVGSNTVPNQFPGRVIVTGQFTAYFESTTMRDLFVNETETSIYAVLSSDNTASSKFLGISLSRIKLGGSTKSDGEGGIIQTFPFQALLNTTGGAGTANENSTIAMQDSDA